MSAIATFGAAHGGLQFSSLIEKMPALPANVAVAQGGGSFAPSWSPTVPQAQITPANVVTAPDHAARVDFAPTTLPHVVQPAPSAASAAHPADQSDWFGAVKGYAHDMQNTFEDMVAEAAKPVDAPDIPGGEALARFANEQIQFAMKSAELSMSMEIANNTRSVGKKMLDKVTEMKD